MASEYLHGVTSLSEARELVQKGLSDYEELMASYVDPRKSGS